MQVILIDSNIASHRFQEIFNHVKHDLHAGEIETSLMLGLHPEYVSEIKKQNDPVFVPQSFMDYFDVTEVTEDGYWGFPEEGTPEKGRKAMDLMVQCGLDYINDVENVTMKLKSKSIVMEKDI